MMRNLDNHRAEEIEMGFNWTQWQVEQIKALERYKAENKKKFTKQFSNINASIDAMIFAARQAGGTEQEQKILRAIKKDLKHLKCHRALKVLFQIKYQEVRCAYKSHKGGFC